MKIMPTKITIYPLIIPIQYCVCGAKRSRRFTRQRLPRYLLPVRYSKAQCAQRGTLTGALIVVSAYGNGDKMRLRTTALRCPLALAFPLLLQIVLSLLMLEVMIKVFG